ncbi:MAG: pyrimidine 5'-nucleotidase [Pseudomonadota bacterium]
MTTPSWIIDLDNTLYRADTHLFDQIDVRMGRYIADMFKVDRVEARRIQKDYFLAYGTTLSGLIDQHDIDPHPFLEFVHDIDVSPIPQDPHLKDALTALPGQRYIYTNGSYGHAQRVLDHLGLAHIFDGIFDIAAAQFEAKPALSAMERCVNVFGIAPQSATMIDDMAKNLEPAAAMGMHTVWIDTGSPWAAEGHGPHIKETATCLKSWLQKTTFKTEDTLQ